MRTALTWLLLIGFLVVAFPVAPSSAGTAAICDDGNACTDFDVCSGEVCTGVPVECMDDGDPCTVSFCDPISGCVTAPKDCDDGNPCTQDLCVPGTGICLNVPGGGVVSCDTDPDDCVDYVCAVGACIPVMAADGSECDDGESCTIDDSCLAGVCAGDNIADGTPCAAPGCGVCSGGTCDVFSSIGASCDDGTACTESDICLLGTCIGVPINCSGGDLCSVGVCDFDTGECSTVPLTCDDFNPCTNDSCNPASGCQFTPVANGTSCDDGNQCTDDSLCFAGACVSSTDIPDPVVAPVAAPASSRSALLIAALLLAVFSFGRIRRSRMASSR